MDVFIWMFQNYFELKTHIDQKLLSCSLKSAPSFVCTAWASSSSIHPQPWSGAWVYLIFACLPHQISWKCPASSCFQCTFFCLLLTAPGTTIFAEPLWVHKRHLAALPPPKFSASANLHPFHVDTSSLQKWKSWWVLPPNWWPIFCMWLPCSSCPLF